MVTLFIYFILGILFILIGIPIIQAITDFLLYVIDIGSSFCIKIIYDIKSKTKIPSEEGDIPDCFPIGFQVSTEEEFDEE